MNLYMVSDADYEWCCFAFDTSRNRAKMRVAEHFGMDYVDMRCKTLKMGVNVQVPMLVDCETDKGYDKVMECGFFYVDEEGEAIK